MTDLSGFEIGKEYKIRVKASSDDSELVCLQYRFRPPMKEINGEVIVEKGKDTRAAEKWVVNLTRSEDKRINGKKGVDVTEIFQGCPAIGSSNNESLLVWQEEEGIFTLEDVATLVNLSHIPRDNPKLAEQNGVSAADERFRQLRKGTGTAKGKLKRISASGSDEVAEISTRSKRSKTSDQPEA
jgi:hypothetical protein